MYATRQPITASNYAAFEAAQAAAPKPLVSNAGDRPRAMSVAIMGEWLRARPGVLEEDIRREFTAAERQRFLTDAIDYAIRRSGDIH